MANIPIIVPTTGAVSVKQTINAMSYPSVIVACRGLAAAEEADLFINVAGDWDTLKDIDGNVLKFTASITMMSLDGGAIYAVTKDATGAATGVDMIPQQAF